MNTDSSVAQNRVWIREIASAFPKIQFKEWLLPSTQMQRRLWPLGLGLLYIAAIALLGGLRSDHIVFGLLPLLDIYNEKTRRFLAAFLPFILVGVIYDSMRYYYWQGIAGRIYIAEPYFRDLKYFGVSDGGVRLTLNEYFAKHTSAVLDLACGFAYLVYVSEYLVAAFYLFFRERWRSLKIYGASFFIVNILGFITYYIYAAAPPWYVTAYGTVAPPRLDVHANAAAAARFDQLLGTHFFDQIYGRGVDVYGAYPSLHVAYPLLTFLIVCQQRELKWLRLPAFGFYLLMCLSAVYLQHHYLVDILMGTGYALGTWVAVQAFMRLKQKREACSEQRALNHGTQTIEGLRRRTGRNRDRKVQVTANLILLVSALAASSAVHATRARASDQTASPSAIQSWEQIDQDDGIQVYKKRSDDSSLIAFRGVGVVDSPISRVVSVLTDTTRFLEWTPKIAGAKDLRRRGPLERVEYLHTSSGFFLVKDRDFVFKATAHFDRTTHQIRFVLTSVDDPLAPETDKVRGTLKHGAYTLTSVDGGTRTLLEVEIEADPNGSVPKWLVNLFQRSWPRETINGIRRQAGKADLLEDPGIKELLDS